MGTEVLCPTAQRPCKRALSDFDSAALPTTKCARQSPPPPPSLPTHGQRPKSSHPPRRLSSISLDDLDTIGAPPRERRRPQLQLSKPTDYQPSQLTRSSSAPPWPSCAPGNKRRRAQLPTGSSVDAWIDAVLSSDHRPFSPDSDPGSPPNDRPSTCPATVDASNDKCTPLSLMALQQMFQQPSQGRENVGSSSGTRQSSKPGTSHPFYRATLHNNHITIDISGRKIPEDLRTFVNTEILQRRGSPRLRGQAVSDIIDTVEEIADSTQGATAGLLRTDMFPFKRLGISAGGNSQWSTIALPNNSECHHNVSTPKPDIHLGYSINQKARWSYAQSNVITHPIASPYTQPARGNSFPFLILEMKSEATGGTLFVAENQAAGSGSHSVNALLWLLREAGTYDSTSLTDTIAFTITMSQREAIFHLHWYSEADGRYYMSFLKSYSSVTAKDIRACNNTVKNIIDHALKARVTTIGKALDALVPFPQHWRQASCTGTAPSTPTTIAR